MMNFRTIKTALVEILESAEAGRWQTVGAQRQTVSAREALNENRFVRVTYDQGDLSLTRSAGSTMHKITYLLLFQVSADAKADLSIIDNPGSTPAQIVNALAAKENADERADQQMDELWDLVYQTVMNREIYRLNIDGGKVFDKITVSGFQKGEPEPRGELVSLTAAAQITCNSTEAITGVTPTPGNSIDTTLNINDDTGDNAGTENIP